MRKVRSTVITIDRVKLISADAHIALMQHEPSRPLSDEWIQQVLSEFSHVVLPAMQRTTNFGFLTFLPAMVVATGHDSPVGLVFQAISYAFRCTGTDDPLAMSKRAMIYGRGLTATNAALREPSLQTRDETVTAVWLLSLYELIVGSSPPQSNLGPTTWSVHTQGMATLLRLRGTKGFNSPITRNLFWLLFSSVQIQCLVTGSSCPPGSLHWLGELEKHVEEAAIPVLQMSLYGCHAAALCERVRKSIDDTDSTSLSVALGMLGEIQDLQTESYEQTIPRGERYTTSETDPRTIPLLGPRTTFARTLFCSYKLKFLLCRWELLRKAQGLSSGSLLENLHLKYRETVAEIRTAADEILATAPNMLDKAGCESWSSLSVASFWADGIRLLWPLRLLAFLPVARTDQRRSAALMLRALRDAMGLQLATQDLVLEPEQDHPAARALSAVI
ncbi:hypothetical protein PV08_08367 [Exophiala spinifera]|uniref:Transcription factor domain-containing protein n=1 Tax=Exophiala spinifera TaxID=91928 RepID=A0A0D2B3F8_9EURO|nr:uncharacterized protein PV08_08367 [Exophiala spinifera]KIW13180.1 hypothetical protein PV08_08367 [Exophiala spinifera]